MNSKCFAAALALLLTTSCSKDDIQEVQTDNVTSQASSAVSDNTPTNGGTTSVHNAAALVASLGGNNGEAWSVDDSIRIYRLGSMNHNAYKLSEGSGTPNAVFTRTRGTDDYASQSETLYALTSCNKYFYGISSNDYGQAKLNVTIPNKYSLEEVGAADGSTRKPVSYWGTATFGSDGRLNATFNSLTSLLHIDTSRLPADTRAVVLTSTYYPIYLNGEVLDNGNGEPLSGTFETVLQLGSRLTPNEDFFYTYDSLRVNFGDETPGGLHKNLYIPIVSPSYKKLHVIAVTSDVQGSYRWNGYLLKTFTSNTLFDHNTIVPLQTSTGIKVPTI